MLRRSIKSATSMTVLTAEITRDHTTTGATPKHMDEHIPLPLDKDLFSCFIANGQSLQKVSSKSLFIFSCPGNRPTTKQTDCYIITLKNSLRSSNKVIYKVCTAIYSCIMMYYTVHYIYYYLYMVKEYFVTRLCLIIN